jgi:hypothetical protein
MTKSIIRCLGVGVLVLGLSAPALAKENEIAEVLAQIGILNDKLNALQEDVDNLPGGLGPCEVPPVWGQTYATAARFVPVLGGAAFCDKATGLVWDGSPDTSTQASWQFAINHCTLRPVGGQKGFHLPTIEQLASLADLTAADLNGDGPFTGVQPSTYWSATTIESQPTIAYLVIFQFGSVSSNVKVSNLSRAWCVRGGQAYDGQDVLNVVPGP